MTGILHGKTPSYLSTIMPNTFSMAPRYVRDFVDRNGYEAPAARRVRCPWREARPPVPPATPGRGGHRAPRGCADGRARARAALHAHGLPDRARLVVTSPPYLRVLKYGYYNWLRTWLLGFDARAIDAELDDAHQRTPYLAFLREVLTDLRPALTDDGIAVIVIGEVEMDRGKPSSTGIGLAERVWEEAAHAGRLPPRRPRALTRSPPIAR